ncbi:MAG TPA: hypothetical protein VHL98_14405 [Microvirga sp.]|jgi:hypothetical protein|nr:hypothetical protein [Microvirga sp.]
MAPSLDYRVYHLDRAGRIVRAEVVRCAGDPEAIAAARARAASGPYSTELWLRSRRIGYFPQGGQAAAGDAPGA